MKIGRFAISSHYQRQGVGEQLMYELKHLLLYEPGRSSFRFLTVDAYLEAIPFYERNGFARLTVAEGLANTRAMYFDMMQL